MQDAPSCNAGMGSNLTEGGRAECDASLMSGDGTYAAVGAAAGVAHPIEVAYTLAQESKLPMRLGRVRPMYAAFASAQMPSSLPAEAPPHACALACATCY